MRMTTNSRSTMKNNRRQAVCFALISGSHYDPPPGNLGGGFFWYRKLIACGRQIPTPTSQPLVATERHHAGTGS